MSNSISLNGDDRENVDGTEKVVIVLGAGFSKAVCSSFPLTDELGEMVRKRLAPEDKAKLPKSKFKCGRFEEWLSYLSEPQPHLTEIERLEAEALAGKIIQAIFEVLSNIQNAVLKDGSAPQWFWQFLSVIHAVQADVLTLNYDNLIESGVHSFNLPAPNQLLSTLGITEDDILAGLPPCADFPDRNIQTGEHPEGGVVYGSPAYANKIIRRQSTFKLMKLHGSLSWYWLPGGGGNSTIRRWKIPGTFGELWNNTESKSIRHQELPAHEVFIVPPTTSKSRQLTEPAIQEIWRTAAKSVEEADRIVFIGYSMPPADNSMMGLLSDGIRDRDVQIQIVNPCGENVKKRLVRLGISPENIKLIDDENSIDIWTTSEVEHLSRQSIDTLRQDNDKIPDNAVLYTTYPRATRFKNAGTDGTSLVLPPGQAIYSSVKNAGTDGTSLVLHLVPEGEVSTTPVKYSDIVSYLDSYDHCMIEDEGRKLPVIKIWVPPNTIHTIPQLHLLPAGRL